MGWLLTRVKGGLVIIPPYREAAQGGLPLINDVVSLFVDPWGAQEVGLGAAALDDCRPGLDGPPDALGHLDDARFRVLGHVVFLLPVWKRGRSPVAGHKRTCPRREEEHRGQVSEGRGVGGVSSCPRGRRARR